ncbi:MAG TPA: signal recognition particle-docking protein FtsY [Acidobacteriota bacterium]|nr:signal recognition particle-docking protein FtsY [Acidobacteriota bacterium]HRR56236.1 signal recognition particle-docking protein FtsY [Acidobacteriota bacterium]HRV07221.1 signal recognition particle-docking protein FtsY [Acidobacteriota bacterium]
MSLFNYQEPKGYFQRLKDAFRSTREDLSETLSRWTGSPSATIDESRLEELEEVLLASDMGVGTTEAVLARVRSEAASGKVITGAAACRLIREVLLQYLRADSEGSKGHTSGVPRIEFIVGVNGVGKTTTIGKLAHLYGRQGEKVLLAAADTFRAAAIEQLEIWAERVQAPVVRQRPGADPAAVLFDAISSARSRGCDVVLVDTAGRLHTKTNLMKELEKMRRIAAREVEGAPHEVFLILDATTGQNGLAQAREFLKAAGVTGVIVTKLDGTAKGGILVAVARELGLPIRYIGLGESIEDLAPFDPEAYVDGLLPEI